MSADASKIMWEQHCALFVALSAVGAWLSRWIVRHVQDVKAKLNGYTVVIHKDKDERSSS